MEVHEKRKLLEAIDILIELVASWGGLADAKVAVKVSRHKKYLKRAIADVESCMEVSSESN